MVFRTVTRAALASGKRMPMIKFRKGGPVISPIVGASQPQHQQSVSPSVTVKKETGGAAAVRLPTIDDWALPDRYRRKPISDYECDYINRGGPN